MPNLSLEITESAENDMAAIFDFIAEDNRDAAISLILTFNKAFDRLLMFPNSGFVKAKHIKREIRICVVANHYQIAYYVQNDKLFIQRVLSGYQDICEWL